MKKFFRIKVPLWLLLLVIAAIGMLLIIGSQSSKIFAPIFETSQQSRETQVIRSLKQEKEISLLSLGIVDLYDEEVTQKVFNTEIIGTKKLKYIRAEFTAKLGIDGKKVTINKTKDNVYEIVIPKFIFIGHDNAEFEVAVTDNALLSFFTPEIDEVAMVNKILDRKAQEKYIDKYTDLLEESTKNFYNSIIKSVDETANLQYTFTK